MAPHIYRFSKKFLMKLFHTDWSRLHPLLFRGRECVYTLAAENEKKFSKHARIVVVGQPMTALLVRVFQPSVFQLTASLKFNICIHFPGCRLRHDGM